MSGTGFGSFGVYLGEGTRFACHTYPDKAETGPILAIDLPELRVTVSNAVRGAVGSDDVTRARELLRVVTTFVAEVERLHSAAHDNRDGDQGQDGGGCAA